MKSGTSSLHTYLGAHPQIFMCEPKEPNYFLEEFNWSRGEEWYLPLFARAGAVPIVGESSVNYTKSPTFSGVPQRIAWFNPEARFVYIMRDPVERTISHYWHAVSHQLERRDMLTAIRDTPHFRHVSHYAAQLAPYFEFFGEDRVFTLTLEDVVADPLQAMRRLFAWLGVDAAFVPPHLGQHKNVTPQQVVQVRGRGLLLRFRRSHVGNCIASLIPPALRGIAWRFSVRPVDRPSQPVDKVVDFLRPMQLEQTQQLSKLLNRQFPEWTTLFGTKPLARHVDL
jgi:hypothetical protein